MILGNSKSSYHNVTKYGIVIRAICRYDGLILQSTRYDGELSVTFPFKQIKIHKHILARMTKKHQNTYDAIFICYMC